MGGGGGFVWEGSREAWRVRAWDGSGMVWYGMGDVGGEATRRMGREMACDFLLMATALLLESSPAPAPAQAKQPPTAGSAHRATLPKLPQNNSDEEGPRYWKSSSGQLGIHEPK